MVDVGVLLDPKLTDIGEWLADAAAYDAAGADALWVDPDPAFDALTLVAALAAVTFRARLVITLRDGPAPRTLATVELLTGDRLVRAGELSWERVPTPESRAAWRETRADAGARGVAGLILPAGPRLLDLLRNPDDPGGRDDLQIAQG